MMDECVRDGGAKVTLLVYEDGHFVAIGGEREPGEGDMPYVGLERIKKHIKQIRNENRREMERINVGDVVRLKSGGQDLTVVAQGFNVNIGNYSRCAFFDGAGVCQERDFPTHALAHAKKEGE